MKMNGEHEHYMFNVCSVNLLEIVLMMTLRKQIKMT